VPAERPSKPRLGLKLALAGVGSVVGGIVLAFMVEYVRNLRRRPRAV